MIFDKKYYENVYNYWILVITKIAFAQQQIQTQARISILTNALINNVSNVSFNNDIILNNIQVLSSPRPRNIVKRKTRRAIKSITNIKNTNKTPAIVPLRRIARRPMPRIVSRVTTSNSTTQTLNNNVNLAVINAPKTQPQVFVNNNASTKTINLNPPINISKLIIPLQSNGNATSSSHLIEKLTVSSVSSSSNRKSNIFFKKISKFKRNFFGKLSKHKKSKHPIDICFKWKN